MSPYADPDKKRQVDRDYGNIHREARLARSREWNLSHPDRAREHQRRYYLRKKYDLSPSGYSAMLLAQGGACAVCGATDPGIWQDFPVDHDHMTGSTRGLLCSSCNTGIGQFRDDPMLLRAAADYLERYI